LDPQVVIARLSHFEGEYVRVAHGRTGFHRLVLVPRGHCWLEGDNARCDDDDETLDDSRVHGPVPLALVEGRVACVVWPPSRVGWVE